MSTYNMEELLQEESKGSRLQIPLSLLDKITAYQKAYKLKHNRKISREHVIIKMMMFGTAQLDNEALQLKTDVLKS